MNDSDRPLRLPEPVIYKSAALEAEITLSPE
jgi:hypothetical protein